MLVQHAAVNHRCNNLFAVGPFHSQLNLSVIDEENPSRLRLPYELRVCRVDALGISFAIAREEGDGRAFVQFHWPAAFEATRTNLGAAQILEDRHDFRRAGGGSTNPLERLSMLLV